MHTTIDITYSATWTELAAKDRLMEETRSIRLLASKSRVSVCVRGGRPTRTTASYAISR